MKLKDNFTQKDISKTFEIFKDKVHTFVRREKAIWAELGYEEFFARSVEAWDRMNTRRIFAAGGAIVAVGMIAFTVNVVTQPNAFLLEIDGQEVGFVESQEVVDAAVADLESAMKTSLGVDDVTIEDGVITCTATRQKKLSLLDEEGIQEQIADAGVCQVDAWSIVVNGESLAATASQEAAGQVLTAVKENYKSSGAEIVGFSYKEEVAIKACTVSAEDLVPVEEAVTYILTGSEQAHTYTVQDGDTLWDIAFANDMKPAELIAANPDFDPNKLKIGQELNLVAVQPYVTVSLTERMVANEAIPFDTVYEDTSTLSKGKTKVKTAGVSGQKEVVSEIVKENGRIVSSKVLSETVLSQPVAQVALRGTKVTSSGRSVYTGSLSVQGSGTIGNPLASIIPSQNGGMYGASRGGRRHVGVDLRSSNGAPIYSADSGTVTQVSSNGSYGKLIVVNHGNGIVTKYAHCSSIGVAVGQQISKGQQIGKVGNTGNATGYILHFEVIVNGRNVNPLNYL